MIKEEKSEKEEKRKRVKVIREKKKVIKGKEWRHNFKFDSDPIK